MISEAAPLSVVTGGSRGIGRAFVLEAVRRGHRVVFSYLSRDADARETERLAAELGGVAQGLRADLTAKQGIATLAEAARAIGEASLLVNNAGVSEECTLDDMTPEAWERAVALNLTAPTFLAQALAPGLRATRGAILNVSSDGGVAGSLHGPPYGATKAGLIGLTKTLARALAPEVRCNAIAPGPVATEMWFSIAPDVQQQVLEHEMPLKRIAQPEDIARAGLDIASWPDATGIVVVLDGGRIM
ncbi:MAG TPA: SDR family oxidoreductase [Candidatus Dormibacteraeota bacterium]|nr:SDR family oxidoreductase [Candidatus Dormibacteraeota bacterium]